MPLPVWASNGHRTPLAHKLVLSVNACLRAHGWTPVNRKKAVLSVIGELHDTDPAFKKWGVRTLLWAYYYVLPLPAPPRTEEDRWMSLQIGGRPLSYDGAQQQSVIRLSYLLSKHARLSII